jgi:beta-N-acetylhexosaminidase
MRRIANFILAISLLLPSLPAFPFRPVTSEAQQSGTVFTLMAQMTPAEKVGQLFLVTFYGPSADPGIEIERLIAQYHVGGVVLLAANDNITDTANTPGQVLTLTNQLQATAFAASQIPRETMGDQPPEVLPGPFIPLFIGLNHEGDVVTEIRSGLTVLPNAMAIGATWDPAQAGAAGRITGEELNALGINLLLGPALDVLDSPRPESRGDPGTRTLGGEPFWVGRLGQAYIRGVHEGSRGQMAVVAKHFPGGYSSSDRNPDDEVPTVRKSLEQLKQVDLLPFFAVTGQAPEAASTTDALLTTHIQFQGFRDNRLQSTDPFNLDAQALGQVLALPEVAAWRGQGGLTVSDALGAPAIRRYYGQRFNPRRIAQQAFNAGNDVLFLSGFGLTRSEHFNNIADTIDFFVQTYNADPVFQKKVDDAVERILTLKLRQYGGQFSLEAAQHSEEGLRALGQQSDQVRELAEASATRLSGEVNAAPGPNDHLVIFTDIRTARQCSTCPAATIFDEREFETALLKLYGPEGSGQVRASSLQSFSFEELYNYLTTPLEPLPAEGTPTPEPSPVETALLQADWIIFNMLNVTPDTPASGVVSDFIDQRPDLLQNKRVVVYAFNAPYYLDSTELTKLTAFFALYSRTPAFVSTAARLLFGDVLPSGNAPVSVESIGYALSEVTRPHPNQPLQIVLDIPPEEGTAQPVGLKLGDTLRLRTEVILDLNGHIVRDGTSVRFFLHYQDESGSLFQEAPTKSGIATISLLLNRIGQLSISARSDPAPPSNTLFIDVKENVKTGVTSIPPPTPAPSETPPPPSRTPPPSPTAVIQPTPTPQPLERHRVEGRDFFMMFLGLVVTLVAGYQLGTRAKQPTRGVRIALCGVIGVLAGYNFFALGLPGADATLLRFGDWAASMWVLLGAVVGNTIGWYWFIYRTRDSGTT